MESGLPSKSKPKVEGEGFQVSGMILSRMGFARESREKARKGIGRWRPLAQQSRNQTEEEENREWTPMDLAERSRNQIEGKRGTANERE